MPEGSIFSKMELLFLRKPEHEKFNQNYVYQLRHSIKTKIHNFLFKDMPLLIQVNEKNEKKRIMKSTYKAQNSILDFEDIEKFVLFLFQKYPKLVLKLFKMEEVTNFLGDDFIEEYFSI